MTEDMKRIVVQNLSTNEEQVYVGITPAQAVVAAFAQSLKDWDSANYSKYTSRLVWGTVTVACGDFCAMI